MIWIPSETEAWEAATVVSALSAEGGVRKGQKAVAAVVVKLRGGREYRIPGPVDKYDHIMPGSLEEEVDNLVNLESFSEGIILHHVRRRFAADKVCVSGFGCGWLV
jgi:hypothetical protein